jgi:hypothetical protein
LNGLCLRISQSLDPRSLIIGKKRIRIKITKFITTLPENHISAMSYKKGAMTGGKRSQEIKR